MVESNIKFASNIAPVKGNIKFDTVFHQKVHDFKALEELRKQRIPLTFEQHKEFNSCSVPCVYTQEKNDYARGTFLDKTGRKRLKCLCTNYDCQYFSGCRGDNEFSDDELIPWLGNDDFEALLSYADVFLEKIKKKDVQQEDDELNVDITNEGIVITVGPKKKTEKKINPYSPIDPIVRLENGIDITDIIPKKEDDEDNPRHLPFVTRWRTSGDTTQQQNRNICTAKTMRIIRALSAKEKRNIKVDQNDLEDLRQASEGGKLKSTGYYGILADIRKDTALRSKNTCEYEPLVRKLRVQSEPLSQKVVTYGTKVTIKDLLNDNEYVFTVLGEEDAKFLNDYKIIPYTSELGSAFWGLHEGSQIKISFCLEEEAHMCQIIRIDTSDYLRI